MKILLLSNKSPWPPRDGGSSATWSLIKVLIENDVSVTVLSFNTSRHKADISDLPDQFRHKIEFILVPLDTTIRPLKLIRNLLASKLPYNIERFISTSFDESLTRVLQAEFDLIQVEGLAMALYIPLIKKQSSARVVFRAHNIENQIWSQLAAEEKNPLIKKYFKKLSERIRLFESKAINLADGIITFTGMDYRWFKKNYPLIPHLVNPPAVKPELQEFVAEEKGTVCFIGALDWRPNINGLTWFVKNVWPVIIKNKPDATFHIAGRNPSGSLIRKLKGKNIIFHGETESSEQFIRSKSIMVVPLFSGSGIRMKILEAMNLGSCIVATPLAARGIIFKDKESIFLASDTTSFVKIVLELLDDEEMRNRAAIFASENVRKNYDIFAATDDLLKFYSELA